MYEIKLERFQGPLDLLLQLVERQELSLTDVSLASVTEQYLTYLDQQTDLPPEDLADFLVVAAKLLLMKSRLLLPSLFVDDEEVSEESLTRQLAIYRQYMAAGRHLTARLKTRCFLYAREKPLAMEMPTFSPPPSLTSGALHTVFVRLLEDLARYVKPAPEFIKRTVSLQEKIRALRAILDASGKVDFHEILATATSRTDIIVSFLALLELIKQRHVVAWQEGHGAAIMVTKVEVEKVPQTLPV